MSSGKNVILGTLGAFAALTGAAIIAHKRYKNKPQNSLWSEFFHTIDRPQTQKSKKDLTLEDLLEMKIISQEEYDQKIKEKNQKD